MMRATSVTKWTGLGLSLLLHAMLLWTLSTDVRPPETAPTPMLARLLPPSPRPAAEPLAPQPPAAAAATDRTRPGHRAIIERPQAPAAPDAAAKHRALPDTGADVPLGAPAPAPAIDLDQARHIARETARGGGAPASALAGIRTEDISPSAILARRLQRRFESETRMTDGSTVLRFSDNVCVVVPAHLPAWQMNDLGPTILPPTNCPGSLSF